MRTVKFRGKKTSTGEWVYGSLITNPSGPHTIVQIRPNPVHNGIIQGWCFGVDRDSVGQFTGLHDKNGKEIYEGDIVKCPVSINQHIHGEFTNRVVKWKEDSFTWVFDSPFSWGRFEDNVTGEGSYIKYTDQGVEILVEKIGTIHENQELLTK